ncbi:MAG: iron complex transport system permease protein [Lentimonas sp.]|jgi:iron complex transport system permease protein
MFKPTTSDSPFRRTLLFGLLATMLLLATAFSICIGAVPLSPKTVITTLMDSSSADPILRQIILDFRVPRILTAMLAGASLATAGLMMQTLFRNPLADPFVLGVNSGASLGVAIVVLAVTPVGIQLTEQLNVSGQLLLILASSGGAALTLFAVLLLSYKTDVVSVLIIGLMISYAVGALVSILIFLSMAERLQSFLSWSFGTYGAVSWAYMGTFAPVIIGVLGISMLLVKPLDALLMGENYAESVGTRTKRARVFILLIASILAGTVTGFCGPVGFLGIAAPHLSRHLFKTSNHRTLIPASIMIGALLSLIADCIAQGPGLDVSLPLNAITALFGAPIIIIALIQQRTLRHTFG